jgi:hypothetical protein
MKKQQSFVLLFTLSIMTLITVLTFQLMRNVFVGTNFDKIMIEREHAEMLALGGVELAMAQLEIKPPKKKDEKEKPSPDETKKTTKAFLQKILPHLNRWQVFELTDATDGIDGKIKICISCEDGKINLNQIFDEKKKSIKPEYQKLLKNISIKRKLKGSTVVKKFANLFKKEKKQIEDVSQLRSLLPIKKMFYEPPRRTPRERNAKPNNDFALFDLFTVHGSPKLEPLFLSDSLCKIFDLSRPVAYDAKRKKNKFKNFIEQFNPSAQENIEQYWTKLQTIYGKKPAHLSDFKNIFSAKFEPKVYSVLSSGTVGGVEQRLLAIIEKREPTKKEVGDKKGTKKKEEKKRPTKKKKSLDIAYKEVVEKPFKIIKLYWI